MIKTTGYSYFFGAAFAATLAIGGCSSSSSSPPAAAGSAEGESCARTADCSSNLVCIAQTCVTKGTPVVGADGGVIVTPVSDAGPIVTVTPDSGSGPTVTPPRLSARGESCQITDDCGVGLSCIPIEPYGFGGICDLTSYGISVTGKTCTGECSTAADCCQLPVFPGAFAVGAVAAVHNCADIVTGVLAGNTAQCTASPAPTAGTAIDKACFLYQTYCTCAANTWACTNNTCSYTASCANGNGYALGGCPAASRIHTGLPTTCTAGVCAAPATVGTCAADADCDGKVVADSAIVNATCRGGDCACVNKGCYVKCNSELDCGQGNSCNMTTHVCNQNGACATDSDCQTALGAVSSKCNAGVCTPTCKSDRDCSESGIKEVYYSNSIARYTSSVCGTDGLCHDPGCQSDTDCADSASAVAGSPKALCVTPLPAPTTPVPHSAVSN